MIIPRIVIAGTNSGCGKTTVTAGIMAALVKKGFSVQPYKVGPDYIDPMFHSFVTGRHSRNLDSWMLDEKTVLHLFNKNSKGASLSVIEGVMGLYDGFGGTSAIGSTAHVAKVLKAPVILLVNGEGASFSICALIKGFMDFDREVDIRGVIINNIKSESHYNILKESIEKNTGIKALGFLTKSDRYSFSSRHLGLIPSGEIEDLKEKIDFLADEVLKTVDLELLVKIAGDTQGLSDIQDVNKENARYKRKPVIGVAMDRAFNFYYRDNLDLLEDLGSELVYFSPINDNVLPESIQGLYIGGGYPEVYAREISSNLQMKKRIQDAINRGMPSYAECGGLMYMSENIIDRDGNSFEMMGIIPAVSEMTSKLQRFGYVDVQIEEDCVLSNRTSSVRAHEFHYSKTTLKRECKSCYKVLKHRNDKVISWECGYKVNNLLAGYPHIHFWANPDLAKSFVENCANFKG
ncbi:MAG TPA: cobyrinate a,c-diamide synthase [Clostridia bacterium]